MGPSWKKILHDGLLLTYILLHVAPSDGGVSVVVDVLQYFVGRDYWFAMCPIDEAFRTVYI